MNEKEELENYIIDNNIATEDELDLVSKILGDNIEMLERILYIRTGFRNINQVK